MEKEKGYVYILTNDSFREDWVKIGRSSRPVDVRSKELDNTAVPLPFKVYATIQTTKYTNVERIVHKQIDRLTDLRIRQNREFFNVEPTQALDILLDLATAIDDAVVMQYVDDKPVQLYPSINNEKPQAVKTEKHVSRKPFEFAMVGLKDGDMITFAPLNIQVKVNGKNKVEFEGRLWSLSAFTGTYLPIEKQNNSGAYQGPKYFTYNNKTLWDLRLELEKQGEN
ncbi:MAG: GIY-YIG nuclease family protein [Bacteroidales bacterium]|nr:GIY-YIG nuclease family protein [Bacteroidales bacterium]